MTAKQQNALLPYMVQEKDYFGYDFGGRNGGIASFLHKGDAYAFAKTCRGTTGKEYRVVDLSRKGKVEFVFSDD